MLIDENAAVIEPRKGKREEGLPALGMLIFTPQDIDLFFRCFSQPPKRTHRIFLVDVYTGAYGETGIAVAGPMLGAPQAVLVLEKLIALGVREVVAVGWCGSLQEDVRIGDVVLPIGAVSEEGTSKHYPLAMDKPGPSPEILQPLRDAFRRDLLRVHEGRVWSTDAPYRETMGKVVRCQKEGVLAVDMETSALLTVARFRGVSLAVVLIVSDDLSNLSWTHGFKDIKFKHTREKLSQLTLKVICSTLGSFLAPGRDKPS